MAYNVFGDGGLQEAVRQIFAKLKTLLDGKVPTSDYSPVAKTAAMTQAVGKDANGQLWTESNAPTIVTLTAPPAITLADNHEYFLYDVSDLTITFPAEGHWEAWIALHVSTLASGAEVIFPEDTRFIGDSPVFEPSDIWEISIVDGVVIAGRVR